VRISRHQVTSDVTCTNLAGIGTCQRLGVRICSRLRLCQLHASTATHKACDITYLDALMAARASLRPWMIASRRFFRSS